MTTTPLILTHSDIMDFLRCRRLFKWSVVEDWSKPEGLVGATALGSRVHAAIEAFHKHGVDPVDAHTDLIEAARAKTVEAPEWIRLQLEDDALVGTNCVMAFRNWIRTADPYAGWNTVGTEMTVSTPLLGGRVLLQGKIDLLLEHEDTGAIIMDDYKTMAPTRVEAAQNYVLRTYQHLIYGKALQDMGYRLTGARYVHLKKVKTLSRTADPVLVSEVPALARSIRVAVGYIETIALEILDLMDAGEETGWYPYPQDSCSWCLYRHPCLLASEGRGAEKMALADQFQHGIRLARYA